MEKNPLNNLKLEVSLKAKDGIDFILAAGLIWALISFIWTLEYSSYEKSVLTFIVGGMMLPLAFLMSRIFNTSWKIKNNPLQPLGLWLNFAQLFYFPFLIFFLLNDPDHFIMAYAIITGAHLFPYAWFYKEKVYAFAAGVIPIGVCFATILSADLYLIPTFTTSVLISLFIWLLISNRRKQSGVNENRFDKK